MASRIRRSRTKVRRLAIAAEEATLDDLVGQLPGPGETVRMVTLSDFSATALISWIIKQNTVVDWFGCVTLRVGAQMSRMIKNFADAGQIKRADFILGHLSAERHGAERDAANALQEICDEHGWTLLAARNHAKVLLFQIGENRYVVETSANLNDLPNWEQFCIENDPELFDWYKDLFWGKGLTYEMPKEAEKEPEKWDEESNPLTSLSLRGINI